MAVDPDMRQIARGIGVTAYFPAGAIIFNQGDPGDCMFFVQTGTIDLMIGDTIFETVGPNETIGFMSMIDDGSRAWTAHVRVAAEVSLINKKQFRFMVDEVPNFAIYLLGVLARAIRGMGTVIAA